MGGHDSQRFNEDRTAVWSYVARAAHVNNLLKGCLEESLE